MRKRMARRAKGGSAGTVETAGGFLGLLALVILMTQIAKINEPGVFKIGAVAMTAIMGGLAWYGAQTRVKTPIGCFAALIIMVLACINLIINPFNSDDIVMYALSFLCLLSVVWVCIDMLILHNRECSSPMPQFETHTGGEDNA